VLAGFVACHRSTEIRGIYVALDSTGTVIACDDPQHAVIVQDSTLLNRYRSMTTGSIEPLLVRLRGVPGHAGSIYGGQRYFFVQEILEMRPRNSGECARVAEPLKQLP